LVKRTDCYHPHQESNLAYLSSKVPPGTALVHYSFKQNQCFPSSGTKLSISKFPNINPKQRACIYINEITAMTSDEQLIQTADEQHIGIPNSTKPKIRQINIQIILPLQREFY